MSGFDAIGNLPIGETTDEGNTGTLYPDPIASGEAWGTALIVSGSVIYVDPIASGEAWGQPLLLPIVTYLPVSITDAGMKVRKIA